MKLLIDTNAFIWASKEPELLSTQARRLLEDAYSDRFVSVASIWEMQIKHARGKLPLGGNVDQVVVEWIRPLIAQFLPIEVRHLGKLYGLPDIHRDPFDRILVAQALSENMVVISSDPVLRSYGITVVW
ncbi:MAG: type II toxin-antitoxin system VapC family toxin [Fimbriimonas sp.]|nr:type II toxin-antitoxin system VapC family toxin [Fimbriimonas sp.]